MTDDTNNKPPQSATLRFGRRVLQVRQALGWTRSQLAERADVTDAIVRNLESDHPSTGEHSALRVLAAIVVANPERARWIAEALDTPAGAQRVLDDPAAVHLLPPPVVARIAVQRGPMQQIILRIDRSAAAKLLRYLDKQNRTKPEVDGISLTVALGEPRDKLPH